MLCLIATPLFNMVVGSVAFKVWQRLEQAANNCALVDPVHGRPRVALNPILYSCGSTKSNLDIARGGLSPRIHFEGVLDETGASNRSVRLDFDC